MPLKFTPTLDETAFTLVGSFSPRSPIVTQSNTCQQRERLVALIDEVLDILGDEDDEQTTCPHKKESQ